MCTAIYAWFCRKTGEYMPLLFICAFGADASMVTAIVAALR